MPKKCSGFFTTACYMDCPKANHEDNPEMYPAIESCDVCPEWQGCRVCQTPELFQKSVAACRVDHKDECP